ncbi:cyclic AMP-dependent transcription factor ATF-2-like [Actinia tenebrosa]|uniref:Cyclic AMP-dependent transcription factor ATF-2-like n=1 Tax=Actinia tenebrosa TaxID=6105 RepID=A0A6P8HVV8_ACTTE|nr:cyclic AMP-dependent transcription factor ATF-2-like [Actinia tenebrosa]
MESDDKPFVCSAPNCGQRFANNDHLESHKQKHQLSLKLPGNLKSTDFLQLADQTPTPTRFLENLEKEGLFQDLENPFDQEFKKAAPSNSEEHPPQSVATTTNSTINENSVIIINAPISASKTEIAIPEIPIVAETVVVPAATQPLTTLRDPPPITPKTSNTSAAVSVLVRTTPRHQIPTVIPAAIANANIPVPAALPVPGHLSRTTGQTSMPVSIPTPAIVSSPSASNPPSFIGSAKQRLKEQLRQNHNNNAINNADNIISQAMTEAVDMVTSENRNGLSNHVAHSQIHHHQQQHHFSNGDHWDENDNDNEEMAYGQKDKKRPRRTQEELDPDERRRKFLERNRAAATRCREKRKIWVQQLEKKADDLSDTNTQLQNEISLLKSEVAQLKSLLLAHKDCPVTLAQQNMSVQNPIGQGNVQPRTNGGHVQVTETPNGLALTVTRNEVTPEDVATTALTQMAQRAMGDPYGGQSNWASAE